jgi:hypothetical protein
MPKYRYYLSRAITDPSPPLDEMEMISADTHEDAVRQLVATGHAPEDSGLRWAHFLASVDTQGVARGFVSLRLRTS